MMDYKHTIDILSENIKELDEIVSGFAALERIPILDLDLVLDKTRNLYEVLLLLKKSAIANNPDRTLNQKKAEPESSVPSSDDSKSGSGDSDKGKKKQEDAPKILSDRFRKQVTSLNENMTQPKSVYDLSSRLQTKPISNIQNAVGLNDKFLFINELFNGDADKYNETIETLNNATHFNEAYNFLVENFEWDMDNELVQKILDLIRRKLIVKKDG
jgi:hypothetical protein